MFPTIQSVLHPTHAVSLFCCTVHNFLYGIYLKWLSQSPLWVALLGKMCSRVSLRTHAGLKGLSTRLALPEQISGCRKGLVPQGLGNSIEFRYSVGYGCNRSMLKKIISPFTWNLAQVMALCRQPPLGDSTAKTQYRKFETNIPRKGIARPQFQFPHSCVCERFIHSHNRSDYSAAGKYVDRSCV
jgi:hypothetical protein